MVVVRARAARLGGKPGEGGVVLEPLGDELLEIVGAHQPPSASGMTLGWGQG